MTIMIIILLDASKKKNQEKLKAKINYIFNYFTKSLYY